MTHPKRNKNSAKVFVGPFNEVFGLKVYTPTTTSIKTPNSSLHEQIDDNNDAITWQSRLLLIKTIIKDFWYQAKYISYFLFEMCKHLLKRFIYTFKK